MRYHAFSIIHSVDLIPYGVFYAKILVSGARAIMQNKGT